MNDYFARFSAAPASFKKSFAMLAIAWICHPLFIYSFFDLNQAVGQAQTVIWRMAGISACLLVLLFVIKNWARALVVMGSCFVLIYDLFVLAVSPSHPVLGLLAAAVTLCTLVGIYWLFVKASRDYFSQLNPKPAPGKPREANGAPPSPRS